jgi:hypothetical protein
MNKGGNKNMNNKVLPEIAENLKNLANSIEAFIKEIEAEIPKNTEQAPVPAKEETVTLEQVRAVLAEKSQSGKQPQVKALIQKYGGNKLTDLDPSCYKELKKEAEEL